MSSQRTCVLMHTGGDHRTLSSLVVCMIQNDALSVRALLVCTMILTLAWPCLVRLPLMSTANWHQSGVVLVSSAVKPKSSDSLCKGFGL